MIAVSTWRRAREPLQIIAAGVESVFVNGFRRGPMESACKDQCAYGKGVDESQREGRIACARTKGAYRRPIWADLLKLLDLDRRGPCGWILSV